MTVQELLGRVDSRELTEWMAFYQIEPFGAERGDLQAGIVASTVANVHRDPKKKREPFKPADFMPEFGKRPQSQRRPDWQKQLSFVEKLNAAFGGKDLRDKNDG